MTRQASASAGCMAMAYSISKGSKSAGTEAIMCSTNTVRLSVRWLEPESLDFNCTTLNDRIGNLPPDLPRQCRRSIARQTGRGRSRLGRRMGSWNLQVCGLYGQPLRIGWVA
jgi:hypothetical protein